MRRIRVTLAATAAALALAACGGGGEPAAQSDQTAPAPAQTTVLNVFAAASLKETFGELEKTFEAANPGVDVTFNFAGSQDLVSQLAEGADADVLATANESTMAKAAEAGLVGEQTVFLSNTLTLVTPKGNPAGVTGLDSSLDNAKLVVCDTEAPCGKLTKELTGALGITLNPVSSEPNVKDVLGKVTSGEADAGIVYRTDANAAKDQVEAIGIQGADQAVNKYPIAPVEATKNAELAQKWIALVLSPEGQSVFERAGFTPAAQ